MADRIGDISPGAGGGGIEGLIQLVIQLLVLIVVLYAGFHIVTTLLGTL